MSRIVTLVVIVVTLLTALPVTVGGVEDNGLPAFLGNRNIDLDKVSAASFSLTIDNFRFVHETPSRGTFSARLEGSKLLSRFKALNGTFSALPVSPFEAVVSSVGVSLRGRFMLQVKTKMLVNLLDGSVDFIDGTLTLVDTKTGRRYSTTDVSGSGHVDPTDFDSLTVQAQGHF